MLKKLAEVIMTGFPEQKMDLDEELHVYWSVQDQLTSVDGLILYGTGWIVIPGKMRKQLLDELHSAHQGQEQTLARARQCLYWPGITRDIENQVKSCEQCEMFKASQAREPLLQDEVPTHPGKAIASDLFSHAGREYLVMTDKYSGWSEIYGFSRGVSTLDVNQAVT